MERRDVLKRFGALGATGLFGSLGAGPLLLAPPADAQGDEPGRWTRVETQNFIVYGSFKEDKLREEIAALEAFHSVLTRLSPDRPERSIKLEVYYASTNHDFELSQPGISDFVAGYYIPAMELTRAVVGTAKGTQLQRDIRSGGRAFDRRLILFHEYVHHFQLAVGRKSYPAWYIEGFAEFLATADFTPAGCVIGKYTDGRAREVSMGAGIDIEKFLDPRKLTVSDMSRYYAQAWLATHMLTFNSQRAAGFDRYVNALTAGGDLIKSFEPAFGITPQQFDKELDAYKAGKIQTRLMTGVTVNPDIPMTVSAMPRSADDLLMPLTYVRGAPGGDQTQTLKYMRSQAARYPDDAFAGMARAYAEVWLGDLAEARKVIDKLLAAAPEDAELHHLSGLCELRSGYAANDTARIAASARNFARAQQIDHSRASSLFRFAEAKAQEPGGMNENALNALAEAWRLTPQVPAICLVFGQALMERGRFEEAVIVLTPIASSAHGGKITKAAAQDLLTKARDKTKPDKFVLYDSAKERKKDDDE